MRQTYALVVWLACLVMSGPMQAQSQARPAPTPTAIFNEAHFQGLQWRNIGPFRGGRSVAVSGVVQQPMVYYLGSTGGGLWKTEDAGLSWNNISDPYFATGSIGAIAVAPSDPNVLYVGTGEHAVRGTMTTHGDGVYKSTDGGETWAHLALHQSRHIAAIAIHPQNPDIVYVAAQGALYGPSEERGVYRSIDGGRSWRRVLYLNPTTGACDLLLDPSNPRILYAGMWDHQRTPWQIRSGGPGSGLFKSTDGGDNWQRLTGGLPAELGKVGIALSPAAPDVLYANIEAAQGGVFRSDDGGRSWRRTSGDRRTVGRAWYYTELVADPRDPETVYVLNEPLLKSIDGGRTFEEIPTPHGDQHHLWIHPDNPANMILANDGGACITFNGGRTWSTQYNQPTGQFYRVIADARFPYYLYGAQQDNSSVAIASRSAGAGIGSDDWLSVAGCENGFIAFDPQDPQLIYGGCYQGYIEVYDRATGFRKDISAYPQVGLGEAPRNLRRRFNWNAPIVTQPQDPSVIYHAANQVLKSTDGGLNWIAISPDLTRNTREKQGPGGGPFTNEGAGSETYNTISYLACSPHQAGVLWAGSDDGLVHLTRNEGANWSEVTPPGLGEATINCIEVSPHDPATAFVVAHRYQFNDLRPYIFRTSNYGRSWERITTGIAGHHFARVVRADPAQPGLLYAGTEGGFYLSFNGGATWRSLPLNLPPCPITDLYIRDNDLIAATAGRAFWILDDLGPLQQSRGELPHDRIALFRPKPTVRFPAAAPEEPGSSLGENPPPGVIIDYYLPVDMDSMPLTLQIYDAEGRLLRVYHNQPDSSFQAYAGGPPSPRRLPGRQGINRFHWDMRRAAVPGIPGVYVHGSYQGSLFGPGEYIIRLSSPYDTVEQRCRLLPDPRLQAAPADYARQQETLEQLDHAIRDLHLSVNRMREVKKQIAFVTEQLKKADCDDKIIRQGIAIQERIDQWEAPLIQTRQQTGQDVINYPNQLNSELLTLIERIDSPDPRLTEGARRRMEDLLQEWSIHKAAMREIMDKDLARFNRTFKEQDLPVVLVPSSAD